MGVKATQRGGADPEYPHKVEQFEGENCPLGWKPGYKTKTERWLEEETDGSS